MFINMFYCMNKLNLFSLFIFRFLKSKTFITSSFQYQWRERTWKAGGLTVYSTHKHLAKKITGGGHYMEMHWIIKVSREGPSWLGLRGDWNCKSWNLRSRLVSSFYTIFLKHNLVHRNLEKCIQKLDFTKLLIFRNIQEEYNILKTQIFNASNA